MSTKLLTIAAACAVAFTAPLYSQAETNKHEKHEGHDHKDHKDHDHEKHDDHKDHDHEKHDDHKGHDHGDFLEVGDHAALLKVAHNDDTGALRISVFKADGKTPMAISDAPRVNITKGGKRAQVKTTPATKDNASVFTATDDKLKGHIHGKIRIKIDGKSYQVDLPDDHH